MVALPIRNLKIIQRYLLGWRHTTRVACSYEARDICAVASVRGGYHLWRHAEFLFCSNSGMEVVLGSTVRCLIGARCVSYLYRVSYFGWSAVREVGSSPYHICNWSGRAMVERGLEFLEVVVDFFSGTLRICAVRPSSHVGGWWFPLPATVHF